MIFITGGSGFIGSHLLDRLRASGEPGRFLSRRRDWKAASPLETAYADLSDGPAIEEALEGVDTVIHLAGATKALRPADYRAANVLATEVLARACARRGIRRLVHVSSLAAAGPSPGGRPLDEEAEPHPISHYGRSKLEAEIIVRTHVPEAVILRPPVVYGPRDTGVLEVLKPIARGYALEITGGPRFFSAIFVADLVDALLAAARVDRAAGRTYFAAHPKANSWGELADAASRIMHVKPKVLRVPPALAAAVGYGADIWSRMTGKPGIISRDKIADARCACWTCDWRRAAAELGFEAKTSLEEGLAQTLSWYKESGWLRY